MNCQSHLFGPQGFDPHGFESSNPASRRWFLRECGLGLGKIGLASLLANPLLRAAALPQSPSILQTHFPAKAKSVIHLFMAGAPSQLDLFDPKPELEKLQKEYRQKMQGQQGELKKQMESMQKDMLRHKDEMQKQMKEWWGKESEI